MRTPCWHPPGRHLRASNKPAAIHAMTIDSDEPLIVYADGDPATQLPLTLSVLPQRLRVLA